MAISHQGQISWKGLEFSTLEILQRRLFNKMDVCVTNRRTSYLVISNVVVGVLFYLTQIQTHKLFNKYGGFRNTVQFI